MYCENCGVKITCAAEKCPLCHAPLEKKDENAVRAFPVAKIKKLRGNRVGLYDVFLELLAAIVCVAFEIIIDTDTVFSWSAIVVACLIYLYFTVRFTVIAQQSFHGRVLGQTIALTVLFVAVRLIVGEHLIFAIWLPTLFIASEIVLIIYILKDKLFARQRFMSLVVTGILGVIPVCAAYVFDMSVKLPGSIVSVLSGATAIVTLIAGRKYVIDELKRYFHR